MKLFLILRALHFFALSTLPVFANAARAQELPTPATPPAVQPQGPNEVQPQEPPSTETKAEEEPKKKEGWKEKEAKLLHGGAIVVPPLPILSPALASRITPAPRNP